MGLFGAPHKGIGELLRNLTPNLSGTEFANMIAGRLRAFGLGPITID
jgi:hypothetical protein